MFEALEPYPPCLVAKSRALDPKLLSELGGVGPIGNSLDAHVELR